jgi:hypothetical protein
LRSWEMPSSVPASVADPAAVVAAPAGAPDIDGGEAGVVLDVADAPDTGVAGVVPDVAARLHPVRASATATRTAALTRWRFT